MDAINARHLKIVELAMRHLEELKSIIIEGMVEGKKLKDKLKNDAKVKIFKELNKWRAIDCNDELDL